MANELSINVLKTLVKNRIKDSENNPTKLTPVTLDDTRFKAAFTGDIYKQLLSLSKAMVITKSNTVAETAKKIFKSDGIDIGINRCDEKNYWLFFKGKKDVGVVLFFSAEA